MISIYIGKRSRYCLKFPVSRTNVKANTGPCSNLQGNNFPPAGAKSFSGGLSLSQNSTNPFLTCSKSPISFFILTCYRVPRVLSSSEFCLILCIVLPLNLSNVPNLPKASQKTSSSIGSFNLTSGSSLRVDSNLRFISRRNVDSSILVLSPSVSEDGFSSFSSFTMGKFVETMPGSV